MLTAFSKFQPPEEESGPPAHHWKGGGGRAELAEDLTETVKSSIFNDFRIFFMPFRDFYLSCCVSRKLSSLFVEQVLPERIRQASIYTCLPAILGEVFLLSVYDGPRRTGMQLGYFMQSRKGRLSCIQCIGFASGSSGSSLCVCPRSVLDCCRRGCSTPPFSPQKVWHFQVSRHMKQTLPCSNQVS